MKKLVLLVIFLMIFITHAFAHEGTLGLYLDETLTDCDYGTVADPWSVGLFNLYLYYWRDEGPYLGNACEFMLEISSPSVLFQDPTWADNIEVTIGSITTGISLTGSTCLGTAADVVYIGTIPVFNIGEANTFSVRVVNHPTSYPNPSIFITKCEANNPKHEVPGGWFIFNGTCSVAIEPKSWGAIKNLYR